MSGTLAIAAVTSVMKFLLQNSLTAYGIEGSVGNDTRVTVLPPDQVPDTGPRLNIYFYRAMSNPGWAQNGLPSRNARGERTTNPYLTLDLHYLVTAHGTKDFHGEILLGYAMQIFHENPVLPRRLIRDALTSPTLVNVDSPPPVMAAIAATSLADQIEQIKITPHYLSLEEISNVWSSLQTQYRPTAVYNVSVVLIESKRSARTAIPVRGYNVYVIPFRHLLVTDVIAEDGPGTPILINKKLVLRGQSLRGDDTRVSLAGIELSGTVLEVSDTQISLRLPPVVRAGIQGVQVKHYVSMGTPSQPHRGLESNAAAFVLQPLIEKTGSNYDLQVLSPSAGQPRRLRVRLSPLVDLSQRAAVLLNEFNSPADRPARAYTLEAISRAVGSPATDRLEFPISGIESGEYLVRVRVDGAESPLDFVLSQGYISPKVTIS